MYKNFLQICEKYKKETKHDAQRPINLLLIQFVECTDLFQECESTFKEMSKKKITTEKPN